MSPTQSRLLLTLGAVGSGLTALLPVFGAVPVLAPYTPLMTALAGLLVGWAHLPKPGDAQKAKDATDALAAVIAGER